MAQVLQLIQHLAGLLDADRLQVGHRGVTVHVAPPQVEQLLVALGHFRLLLGIGDHLAEVVAHLLPVAAQRPFERRAGGEIHGEGEALPAQFVVGQALGLAVVDRLQAVFHIAQKDVGVGQFGDHVLGQHALFHQHRQHFHQVRVAQAGQLAAADQLERLDDELHFADAAGAQFDVRLHALAVHLALDQAFHFPQ